MSERFRPVENPADSYSPWDQGWRLRIAWCASLLAVLLGIGHCYVALKVIQWYL